MKPRTAVPIALLGLAVTLLLPGDWKLFSLPFIWYLGWLPILYALFGHPRAPFHNAQSERFGGG